MSYVKSKRRVHTEAYLILLGGAFLLGFAARQVFFKGETREPRGSAAGLYEAQSITRDGIVAPPLDNEPSTPPAGNSSTSEAVNDWTTTLVNEDHPLAEGYAPALTILSNGLSFDSRAIDALETMLSDARAQGLLPLVCSAYRSVEKQETLFTRQVQKQMALGLSRTEAETEARRHVAFPGTSEHHLGLAADIVSASYQLLDDAQADTPEIRWLHAHCHEYGFILRYPEDKTEITGVSYESWHFRYVGKEVAREITENGLCLEEYLDGH